MKRLIALFTNLFRPSPRPQWSEGVIVTDLDNYHTLYAQTVNWIRLHTSEPIQTPTLVATIRLYKRFPIPNHVGKVLPPNFIQGDTHGTICLYSSSKFPTTELKIHEMKHAITGNPNHPKELFPEMYVS